MNSILTSAAAGGGQPSRHVGDPDGLAHVEYEDLSGPAHRGRLQHEVDRLVGEHEVAAAIGVSHRDRAARLHLRRHGREHRPAAAQHVAEAPAHVPSARPGRRVRGETFGDPLGVAEDADGVRRLVGGDVDERSGRHDRPRLRCWPRPPRSGRARRAPGCGRSAGVSGRVVVQDRHRPVGRVGLRGQPLDQQGTGAPRPEDDDLHGRTGRPPGAQAPRVVDVPGA